MTKIELENKVLELDQKLNHLLENFTLVPKVNPTLKHECKCSGNTFNSTLTNTDPGVLLRKPILYFYNLSGDNLQCSVDFQFESIVDSIPEIREDNKLIFALDQDNFIDNKYKYLYYEISLKKNLPKSEGVVYVQNNKQLTSDLNKFCTMMNLWNNEKEDFIQYWELELKRFDCKYYKCEVYTEETLNGFLPIKIHPNPEFFIRRYIKFTPCDKSGKDRLTIPFKQRAGTLRCVEWGGFLDIDDSDDKDCIIIR